MNLSEYQKRAEETAIFPKSDKTLALSYVLLGLTSETGEICGKLKKIIRDMGGRMTKEDRSSIKNELGDALWYIAMLSRELNIDLNEVAMSNLRKLRSRKERHVLSGSGDNR